MSETGAHVSKAAEKVLRDLLARCDVEVRGSRPWDIRVHDDRLYARTMRQGSLGLGEAYMDGWWDCDALDEFFARVLSLDLQKDLPITLANTLLVLRSVVFNQQRRHVTRVGEKHYDIGNDLFTAMLDRRMVYSCGYWREARTLEEAQEAKLDLICRKIGLKEGQRVLDIGSGWGSFLRFAAERYGIEGVGVTISKEQAAYANASTNGLPIETRLQDYMTLEGSFDRVVSVGMFEHVGYKNYTRYFAKVRSLLAEDGLFLLHTIGARKSGRKADPWFERYIFPDGMLPSIAQINGAVGEKFVMEDWHNFGPDYDPTLLEWHRRFEAAWPALQDRYDERFRRMWRYYLLCCAGAFRVRRSHLWQIVLSPNGVRPTYRSER